MSIVPQLKLWHILGIMSAQSGEVKTSSFMAMLLGNSKV
jgi:hypothetical protein